MTKGTHNLLLILLTSVLLLGLACRKKKAETPPEYPVPNVPVSVNVYPNDPSNFKIQAVGGWIYYPGAGINGLIIYRKTLEEFVVLERTSPENPNNPASAVVVQEDSFTCRDTIKNGSWQIVDGAAINNSSGWFLRRYANSYDGNLLMIRN